VLDISMPAMAGLQAALELTRREPEMRVARRALPLPGGNHRAGSATTSIAPTVAEEAPDDPLSPRELEVVKLIAEGHTSDAMGEMLFISKKTVDRHRANTLEKLGLRNHVELTRYAIRRGLVEP
jgi:DNA-binding NarL/FixJ family response regulator